jgi:HSP20 family protein
MATMTRWSPLRELDAMERRMRRMFEEVGIAPALGPAADVYETEDEFVVELEVPGYEEDELTLEIVDRKLKVTGERSESTEKEEKSFRLQERLERGFSRTFELPAEADLESVRASFGRGVLEVRAPKVLASQPRKIEIQSS